MTVEPGSDSASTARASTAPATPARRRPPVLRALLVLYLVGLGASHAWRWLHPAEAAIPEGRPRAVLREVDGEARGAERVRLVWRERGPSDAREAVLLVHGSPGDASNFTLESFGENPGLANELGDRRVIAVDLPGFGESTRDVPDYSIRAHAAYLAELTDRLGLERVHAVGFSMGGGVALHLAELRPDVVASVTLLSAIGVQELELLGDYHLNHAVHGLQVGLLWLGLEALPHFGAFDRSIFGVEYARNFYDTDQRPLRGILERFDRPLLVIHGEDDFLVPVEAALEHHRIVPQSELALYDEGHFLVFDRAPDLGALLRDFTGRVDAGTATTRAAAAPERAAAASAPWDPADAPPLDGFGLFVVMALLAAATLVSEDLTCIGAGAMVATGRIELWAAALACFAGITFGDLLLFLAGRFLGKRALARAPLRWFLGPDDVDRASRWFARRGLLAIFATRFMPGTRLPTYFAAGAIGAHLGLFVLYFAIAAGVWTPILVWVSSLIGGKLTRNVELFRDALPLALLATVAAGWLLFEVGLPLVTWRGRRLMAGRWRRRLHWEFWPSWLVYPPIAAWVFAQGVARGRLAWFAAANPGIEHGGFLGESKSEILAHLAPAGERVARHAPLPAGEAPEARLARVRAFLAETGLDYPVVVKPDAGQRGSGVLIARTEAAVAEYLADAPIDLLVQQHVPGVELGVFYARRASEPRGRVISITEKRVLAVEGDGESTLERLILAHPRAVCYAKYFLAKHSPLLDEILAPRERFALGELGTHSRGALFLDGVRWRTEALVDAVDALSKHFDGFHFGRYDLRGASYEAIARGEFQAIELNGVTSEATHLFDPKYGYWTGVRGLLAQWRECLAIADENLARGAATPSVLTVLREIPRYRRTSRAHRGG